MRDFRNPRYKVLRDREECIECDLCVRQCANEVHYRDEKTGALRADSMKCVNCQRCTPLCPTRALAITRWPQVDAGSAVWTEGAMDDITAQAQTGGVLLASMGNPKSYHIYWEHLLLNASQVTNPSIDPLREPMETRVVLGSRPSKLRVNECTRTVVSPLPPQLSLDVPIMFSAMSFGSVSLNTQKALAMAARELGTYFNCGEGGLHRDLEPYADRAIVQVASGRFGVDPHYLNAGAAIEIKIGQGAKPGIGGHLPGEKINEEVSRTRMIPVGTDAISPAPHHDIYSIEDLRQLIFSLKEATGYTKPVAVKVADETDADIGFYHIGGVRLDSIPAGDVGAARIYDLEPFGTEIALMRMTPADMRRMIVSKYNDEENRKEAHRIDLISTTPYVIVTDAQDNALDVRFPKLREGRTYEVAVSDYVFKNYKDLNYSDGKISGIAVAGVLLEELEDDSPLTPDNKPRQEVRKGL